MRSFFSISFDLIIINKPMAYDLYVNSSALETREKYVRVFPIGQVLNSDDIKSFKDKYHRLYVAEDQRSMYLQSLVQSAGASDVRKAEVIKDSAIEYLDNIFKPGAEFTTDLLTETIKGCKDSVESMVDVVQDYGLEKLQELIGKMSFHDFYTYDHSINVSMYSIGIYRIIKPDATKDQLIMAGMGGLLHDLGKTQISNEIINFTGKLSDEMFDEIKKHPGYGQELVQSIMDVPDAEVPFGVDLSIIQRVVYEHHENYNGTGYPNKLAGEDIHLMARVTAIADFFDAITTKRSYHDVLSVDEALHVMASTKGKKIDPEIFDMFCANAKVLIKQGNITHKVEDSFDPCQPRDEMDIGKVVKKRGEDDFGKIKFADRMKPKKKSA